MEEVYLRGTVAFQRGWNKIVVTQQGWSQRTPISSSVLLSSYWSNSTGSQRTREIVDAIGTSQTPRTQNRICRSKGRDSMSRPIQSCYEGSSEFQCKWSALMTQILPRSKQWQGSELAFLISNWEDWIN